MAEIIWMWVSGNVVASLLDGPLRQVFCVHTMVWSMPQIQKENDSKKNFSRAWIDGSTNQKTSNVVDHASSEQHKAVMALLRQEQAKNANEPLNSYRTIVHSLHNPSLDPAVRERLKKKFDVSYLLAKENLPFTKYLSIHELLEWHGVKLGFLIKRENQLTFSHATLQKVKDKNSIKSWLVQNFSVFWWTGQLTKEK